MKKVQLKKAATYSFIFKDKEISPYTTQIINKLIELARRQNIDRFIEDYHLVYYGLKLKEDQLNKITEVCKKRGVNFTDYVDFAIFCGVTHINHMLKDTEGVFDDYDCSIYKNRSIRMVNKYETILKPFYDYMPWNNNMADVNQFISKCVIWLIDHEILFDKMKVDREDRKVAILYNDKTYTEVYDACSKVIKKYPDDAHHNMNQLLYDLMACDCLNRIVVYASNNIINKDNKIRLTKGIDTPVNRFNVEPIPEVKKPESVKVKEKKDGEDFMESIYDPTLKEFGDDWIKNNPRIANKYCTSDEVSAMRTLLRKVTSGNISLRSLNAFLDNHKF